MQQLVRVNVEFYGIPRQRAGTARATVELPSVATLGLVLRELSRRFPNLAGDCLDGDQLRAGYTANIGGDRFVHAPQTELQDGDALLILSADAGG